MMKTLRTFIIMAILIFVGMAMSGCENRNASNVQQTVPADEHYDSQAGEKSKDSNDKDQMLGCIKEFETQIEALSKSQETNTNDLRKESNDMSDFKDTCQLFDLISLGVAVIVLLTAIIALISLKAVNKRVNRHRKEIEELKYKVNSIEQNTLSSTAPRTMSSRTELSNSDIDSMESRICSLERQLDILRQRKESICQNETQGNLAMDCSRADYEQNGYFALPSQISMTKAYFKRLSDIRESDSRFIVEVRNDKAIFRPLEGTQYLKDLISNDSIKMAIEIQGCTPAEANQMKVVLPGEAKKDGDRWIITKKAIIALYR